MPARLGALAAVGVLQAAVAEAVCCACNVRIYETEKEDKQVIVKVNGWLQVAGKCNKYYVTKCAKITWLDDPENPENLENCDDTKAFDEQVTEYKKLCLLNETVDLSEAQTKVTAELFQAEYFKKNKDELTKDLRKRFKKEFKGDTTVAQKRQTLVEGITHKTGQVEAIEFPDEPAVAVDLKVKWLEEQKVTTEYETNCDTLLKVECQGEKEKEALEQTPTIEKTCKTLKEALTVLRSIESTARELDYKQQLRDPTDCTYTYMDFLVLASGAKISSDLLAKEMYKIQKHWVRDDEDYNLLILAKKALPAALAAKKEPCGPNELAGCGNRTKDIVHLYGEKYKDDTEELAKHVAKKVEDKEQKVYTAERVEEHLEWVIKDWKKENKDKLDKPCDGSTIRDAYGPYVRKEMAWYRTRAVEEPLKVAKKLWENSTIGRKKRLELALKCKAEKTNITNLRKKLEESLGLNGQVTKQLSKIATVWEVQAHVNAEGSRCEFVEKATRESFNHVLETDVFVEAAKVWGEPGPTEKVQKAFEEVFVPGLEENFEKLVRTADDVRKKIEDAALQGKKEQEQQKKLDFQKHIHDKLVKKLIPSDGKEGGDDNYDDEDEGWWKSERRTAARGTKAARRLTRLLMRALRR